MHSLPACSIDPPKTNLSSYCVWLCSRNRQRLDGLNEKYTAVAGPVRLADHFTVRGPDRLLNVCIFMKWRCWKRPSLVKTKRYFKKCHWYIIWQAIDDLFCNNEEQCLFLNSHSYSTGYSAHGGELPEALGEVAQYKEFMIACQLENKNPPREKNGLTEERTICYR